MSYPSVIPRLACPSIALSPSTMLRTMSLPNGLSKGQRRDRGIQYFDRIYRIIRIIFFSRLPDEAVKYISAYILSRRGISTFCLSSGKAKDPVHPVNPV